MASIDPRLQPQYSHPHAQHRHPSHSHPQQQQQQQQQSQPQPQSQPSPLNPSAYASSNPPTRLPRIHPASDTQSYPPHQPSVPQPYYSIPPNSQAQATAGADVTTPPSQRYGSPHYNTEGNQDPYNEGEASPIDGNENNDPKRSRACESCRSLKVRCDQDPENPDAPCKRCAKAKRQCIITAPSRKRQKKTDSRVAELEKKIDALTASLNAQNPIGVASSEGSSHRYGPANMSSPDSTQSYGSHSSRTVPLPHRDPPGRESVEGPHKRPLSTGPYDKSNLPQTRRFGTLAASGQDETETAQYVASTVSSKIDEILDDRTAGQIFDRYVVEMTTHMPAVAFPPQTTAHQIRKQKPVLFLAILVAASVGIMPLEPQDELTDLLMATLADCVVRYGGKSTELIQAILVAVIWYKPPKRYDQMNFYQLSHVAVVMAIDCGMGKRMNLPKGSRPPTSSEQTTRMPKYLSNSSTVEARRTWLGCYFTCSNVAMTLRRPNIVRWSNYMDECLDVLENSEYALPSDKFLCQFVRLQHINEDIGLQFSMDDPSATINISDTRVQYALKAFENQLQEWSSAAQNSPAWNTRLAFNEHVSSLYMHEVALHINHNVDDFRAPFTEESLRAASGQSIILSSVHSKALSECLASVHGIFQVFFNFDISTIRALPIFYFVRLAYGVVVLIKLYFAVTAPGSELGKIMSKEDLQVEHQLDTLLRIFHTIDEEEAFRPARMFLIILGKMRHWFRANKDNKTLPRDASRFNPWAASQHAEEIVKDDRKPSRTGRDTPTSQKTEPSATSQRQVQQSRVARYNNLHLLSDVATGSSNGQGLASTGPHGAQMQRASPQRQPSQQQHVHIPQQQQQQQQPGGQMAPAYYSTGAQPGFDASAMPDTGEFNMGVGFEQAMDMALGTGEADLSSLFMGDPMFNFGPMPNTDGMHYFQGWQ